MSVISAQLVKELRETTGAGMMDCKKALEENEGQLEAAIDWLRTKGLAKAAKKAGRIAAEGLVCTLVNGTNAVVVEVNAETDFVARNDQFQGLVRGISQVALNANSNDIVALGEQNFPNSSNTIANTIAETIATIGENMSLRRMEKISVSQGVIGSYVHSAIAEGLGKIAVLVALETSNTSEAVQTLAKQIAMHVAATNPVALDVTGVPANVLEREKAVLTEKAAASGKPANVIEKIVESGIKTYFKEVCLVDQPFIHDGSKTVSQVVAEAGNQVGTPIKLVAYARYALGEGIEKEETDFASEVAAAAGGR